MTADCEPAGRFIPYESDHERGVRLRFARLLASSPIPSEELADNLALYLRRQPLTDLLSLDALYRLILDIPGVIMEFGVYRGRHLTALTALRGVYEPYNPHPGRGPTCVGAANERAQPAAASASSASLLARMNSFSAVGFRSTDARSSPRKPIRSRSYPPREASWNSGPLRADSSSFFRRATKKCCTATPASDGVLNRKTRAAPDAAAEI
jgi:hypothetical protein